MLEYKNIPELDVQCSGYHILAVDNKLTISRNEKIILVTHYKAHRVFFEIISDIPTVIVCHHYQTNMIIRLIKQEWTVRLENYRYHDAKHLYYSDDKTINVSTNVNIKHDNLNFGPHICINSGQIYLQHKNVSDLNMYIHYICTDNKYVYIRVGYACQGDYTEYVVVDKNTGERMGNIIVPYIQVYQYGGGINESPYRATEYSVYSPCGDLYSELKSNGEKLDIGCGDNGWWSGDYFWYFNFHKETKQVFGRFSYQNARLLAPYEKSKLLFNLHIIKYLKYKIPKLVWLYKIFPYTI